MYVHSENIQFVLRILVQHMYDVVVRNGTEQNGLFQFIVQENSRSFERNEMRDGRDEVVWMERRRRRCVADATHENYFSFFSPTHSHFFPFSQNSLILLLYFCLCYFTSSNIQFMLEWPSDVYIPTYRDTFAMIFCVLYYIFCCAVLSFSPFLVSYLKYNQKPKAFLLASLVDTKKLKT